MAISRNGWAYRVALPGLALLVFAGFAALWFAGCDSIYFGLLRAFGVHPYSFPFVDAHAILSAAECRRYGVDVYAANPCDALGRPHVYSPLWLSIVPSWLGTADLNAVGLVLDLAFIAVLGIVFRPCSAREAALCGFAVFSPVVVFALERANNDLLVCLAAIAIAALWGRAPRARLAAYALCVAAALLKYYPIVLLAAAARERLRRAALVAASAAAVLLLFGWHYRAEIGLALANIPKWSPFDDGFSALNLPYGTSALVEGGAGWHRNPLAMTLMAGLITACLLLVRPTIAGLAELPIAWAAWEMRCLAVAAIVLPACFFAGQNIAYRGVYLLLLVPGLRQLRAAAPTAAARRSLGLMLGAVYFALWQACLLNLVDMVLAPVNEPAAIAVWVALWLVRELVWWGLIAGLIALAVLCLRGLPLFADLAALLPPRLRPTAAR